MFYFYFCFHGRIFCGFIIVLKKVTSDMQTHKNPSLRGGPIDSKATVGGGAATNSSGKPTVAKTPVFTRDGKKWLIVSVIYKLIKKLY